MNTRGIILGALLLLSTSLGLAGEPDAAVADKLARDLVHLQISSSMLDEIYVQATQAATVNFENAIQPAIKRALTQDEKQRLLLFWRKEMEALLPYSAFEDLLAPIVVKSLSLDELQEIIKFSNSPAGRKLAEVQPILAREGRAAGESFARKSADKDWQARVQKGLQEQFPQWFPKGNTNE